MANPYAPWVDTINYFLTHGATYSNLGGGYWALTLPSTTPSPSTGGGTVAPAAPPPIPEALNQAVGVWGKVIPISMGQRRMSPQVIWLKQPISIGVTARADFAVSWGYNADDVPEDTTLTALYADATKIWSVSEGVLLPGDWSFTFYPGTETQMPDPTMLATNGALETPAYRGQLYAVFHNFPLEKFGYKLPGISAEITGSGGEAPRNDSWNPADAHPQAGLVSPYTLAKGGTGTTNAGVRSRTSHRRGQYYFEYRLDNYDTAWRSRMIFQDWTATGVGVSLATASLALPAGRDRDGIGTAMPMVSPSIRDELVCYPVPVDVPTAPWGTGATIGFHINMDAGYARARVVSAGGAWSALLYYSNPGVPDHPEPGIQIGDPLFVHGFVTVPANPDVGANLPDMLTVNFGGSPFMGAIPDGATAWNGNGGTTPLGTLPLRDFISKIAVYCGLVPEIDLAFDGIDDVIHGGMITKDTTFTDFLAVLGRAYGFDYFEGQQIRIVKRVIGSTYTVNKEISEDDLIVEGDRAIATNRRRDESPNEIELSYIDVTQQFRWNIQRGRRILFPVKSTTSRRKDAFAIPIITTASDALTMATKAMFRDAAQNVDHAVSLLPKHMDIEPADILTLTAGDTEYTVKVTSVAMNVDGRVSVTAVNLLTDEDMVLEADPGSPNLPYQGSRFEWFTEEGADEAYFSQFGNNLFAVEGEDRFTGGLSSGVMTATDRPDVFAGVQAVPAATWNPAFKNAGITLTNSDLSAALTGGSGARGVRGTGTPKSTGKVHVEFRKTNSNTNWAFGICNGSWAVTDYAYSFATTAALNGAGQVYAGSTNRGSPFVGIVDNVWYAMEVDFDAKTFKFHNGSTWSAAYSFSNVTGPYYLVWGGDFTGMNVELNAGQNAFAITPTSGFVAWTV